MKKAHFENRLKHLQHTHYPKFIIEIYRLKLAMDVTCEGCGVPVNFDRGTYVGIDFCGICTRAVATMSSTDGMNLVRCPDLMSTDFLMFSVWWQRINGKEVRN